MRGRSRVSVRGRRQIQPVSAKDDSQASVPEDMGAESVAERVLAAFHDAMRHEMPERFDGLFVKFEDALYDLADKSDNNNIYTGYFDALRVFRRKRQEILALFLKKLQEASEPGLGIRGASDSRATAGESALALMDHAELEENLAVANLISKAENLYRNDLSVLRCRPDSLRGEQGSDGRADPFGPRVLCNAFRMALAPVADVDLAIKLILYKLFDKQVMDQLGGIYARCRDLVDTQGSPPPAVGVRKPVLHVQAERELEGVRRLRADSDASEDPNLSPYVPAKMQHEPAVDFADLQRLLGRRRPAAAGRRRRTVIDTVELVAVLTRLQELTSSEAGAKALRPRLMNELHLGGKHSARRALGPVDEDTLDLVFLLFEHILQGNDIPDALKVLIGRLQIPFLKVALLDKSVFDDKNHPVRRLLNHLAEVAVGWSDEGDRSPEGVYGRVRWVVDQVLERYETDLAVFSRLDAELCVMLAKEQEQAQFQEAKVQQELEIRERRRSAESLVSDVIAERLRGREPVPEAVASLLYEGWQQVLLAVYLRDGMAGAEWRAAVRTVDRLVWSVRPKVEYGDRRELLRSIPELLRTLRESLAQVSYDQRRLARWFKELQALHIVALRGAGQATGGDGSGAPPPDRWSDASLPSDPAGTAVATELAGWDRTHSAMAGLEPGAWIEVRREGGDPIRVKLAWRSPQSGINLFVDRRGRKALELTGKEIAMLQETGTLTTFVDAPAVDRALEEVVQTLKAGGKA